MKPSAVFSSLFALLLSPYVSAVDMTMEERIQSVVTLEQHIEQREQRLEHLADDIRTIDGRVEKGIADIVTMVSSIRDSKDSKLRVAKLKGDIVSRLRKTIEFYETQRNGIREQLRKEETAIPRETLNADLKRFNERIEKRVEQIEKIAASFPEPKDLEKYVVTDTYSWGWMTYQNQKISEEWKQNRRDSKQTDSMQKKFLEGLEESIEHLKQRNAYLAEKLKGTSITPAERELYESDVVSNEALIELRQNQAKEFLEKPPAKGKEVSQNSAHNTELLIRDMLGDLREDFFSIFRKYSELNKERADLEKLHVNLAARQAWLKENDKE
ncbi:MAG: hypothetical protein P1U85_12010 [Verrucomicrobiales bacterium]|nr:hypothetical protein [Verrucomicrobiales bacterium]